MKGFTTWIVTALVLSVALLTGSVLAGEQQKVTLRVDGLACPFCAYGLEKKLTRLDGVTDWDIKINDGLVILHFGEDARVDKDLLKRKVEEAGFTPREITVETARSVEGEPGRDEKEKRASMRTVSLHVSGMACSACRERVVDALSSMDCVERVDVDLESGNTIIECNDPGADPNRFTVAVEKLGFEAEVRK